MSGPQSVEIVVLLSGSLSAEFDLTHVCFIDVPGKTQETDFPDPPDERYTAKKSPSCIISSHYLSLHQSSCAVKHSSFCGMDSLASNAAQPLSNASSN